VKPVHLAFLVLLAAIFAGAAIRVAVLRHLGAPRLRASGGF
jgi:hypothetical protein